MFHVAHTADDEKQLVFVKGHHRIVAMHAGMLFHFETKTQLPGWQQGMVKAVKIRSHGQLPKTEIVAHGIGRTLALQQGIDVCWLQVLRAFGDDAEALSDTVAKHHRESFKAFDFGTAVKLSARIPKSGLAAIERWMQVRGLPVCPFPMTWVHDARLICHCCRLCAEGSNFNLFLSGGKSILSLSLSLLNDMV